MKDPITIDVNLRLEPGRFSPLRASLMLGVFIMVSTYIVAMSVGPARPAVQASSSPAASAPPARISGASESVGPLPRPMPSRSERPVASPAAPSAPPSRPAAAPKVGAPCASVAPLPLPSPAEAPAAAAAPRAPSRAPAPLTRAVRARGGAAGVPAVEFEPGLDLEDVLREFEMQAFVEAPGQDGRPVYHPVVSIQPPVVDHRSAVSPSRIALPDTYRLTVDLDQDRDRPGLAGMIRSVQAVFPAGRSLVAVDPQGHLSRAIREALADRQIRTGSSDTAGSLVFCRRRGFVTVSIGTSTKSVR